jgi:uncharacterized membrane protein YphA (DoxX/SURF4 family)
MKRFLFGSAANGNTWFDITWLLFRIHIGLSIAIHAGLPKITASGDAPAWFVKQVSGLGFTMPSPQFWATIATWGEFLGGLLIAVGLLVRVSAIQLAFQFFVIAFLWYDNPEPLTGMYFQHLLFWGFILIAVNGGGRLSIDHLIMKRKFRLPVVSKATVATVMILFMTIVSTAQQSPVVKNRDLEKMKGNWKGTLTYLDYSSNKPVTIPAGILITQGSAERFVFEYYYESEPGHGSKDTLDITNGGNTISKMKVVERKVIGDSLRIVLEERGPDGNDSKTAIFHHVYTAKKNELTITKLVKFDGQKEFFQRNRYMLKREDGNKAISLPQTSPSVYSF